MTDANVQNFISSSDTGIFTITDTGAATYNDILLLESVDPMMNDKGPRAFTNFNEFANAIDATHSSGTSVENFEYAGNTFSIATSFFTNGNIVMGRNFVTDNDGIDNEAAPGTIEASAAEQTLVGGDGTDTFNDNLQTDTSIHYRPITSGAVPWDTAWANCRL